jgi:hypothetical protein
MQRRIAVIGTACAVAIGVAFVTGRSEARTDKAAVATRVQCKCCRQHTFLIDEHWFVDGAQLCDPDAQQVDARPLQAAIVTTSEAAISAAASEPLVDASTQAPVAPKPEHAFARPWLELTRFPLGEEEGALCHSCRTSTSLDTTLLHYSWNFHSDEQSFLCAGGHAGTGCTYTGGEGPPELASDAIDAGNYAAVARHYRTYERFIIINSQRGLWQALDCSGRVVVSQVRLDIDLFLRALQVLDASRLNLSQ